MFPVTTVESYFCSHISRAPLLEATIVFHALRLLTPTTSTCHHSGWPLLAVATMWLCGGSRALAVPLPSTADRSMVCGWSMHWPAVGHCRVDCGGVKPSGTTT